MNGFDSAEADYDAAMSRFKKLHSTTTELNDTYHLTFEEDQSEHIIDDYNYPLQKKDVITPSVVHRQEMSNSMSWIVVMAKVFQDINLRTSDTLVHVGSGDGGWLMEAAVRHGCQCVGVDTSHASEYRCGMKAHERGISDLIEYEIVDTLLEADLSSATAVLISSVNGTNLEMKALREKLESEVESLTPIVVIGGQEIIGWFPQKTHKHRGVPIYIYLRRTQVP